MYMQKLEKEAKKFAEIKPDTIIDKEEKYYNRGAVEKYEAFLAGANCAYNEFINKACEWFKNNIFKYPWWDNDAPSFDENDIVNDFRKAMEE